MSTAIVFGLLFLFSGHAAIVQSDEGRQIKSCPVLTDTEATTVLGPGTIFVSGVEATSGKVRISLLCEFLQDERTLKYRRRRRWATRRSGKRSARCQTGQSNRGWGTTRIQPSMRVNQRL